MLKVLDLKRDLASIIFNVFNFHHKEFNFAQVPLHGSDFVVHIIILFSLLLFEHELPLFELDLVGESGFLCRDLIEQLLDAGGISISQPEADIVQTIIERVYLFLKSVAFNKLCHQLEHEPRTDSTHQEQLHDHGHAVLALCLHEGISVVCIDSFLKQRDDTMNYFSEEPVAG